MQVIKKLEKFLQLQGLYSELIITKDRIDQNIEKEVESLADKYS